jgi:hypothetical protein
MLKKYKFKTFVSQELGIGKQRNTFVPKGTLSQHLPKEIQNFFERDDVSRQTTGAKRTLDKAQSQKTKASSLRHDVEPTLLRTRLK